MPSFPIPHKQENEILQPSVAKQSQQYHSGNELIVSDMMKGSLPHQDGLPRTYLSPFHRSSSSSNIAVGKENNMQDKRRGTRDNHPTAISREGRTAAHKDGIMDERFNQTRDRTTWSPLRGKREQESAASTSVAQGTRKTDEAEEINRDFERLLDKINISDTARSRLTPLDTPLKRSLLRSPLALNNLIGSDSSSSINSPARPNADGSRAQSTVPAAPGGEYFPSAQTQQGHQIGQAHPQIRKSQSGVNLRGIEGGSPAPTRSQGSTAGMKTEYVDNLKFEVLNGSPVRNGTDKRQKGFSRPGKGKRASYHHTAEGIPVPPPLLPEDGFSPDLQDKEYDFLHDAFQTSRNGDLIDGSFQHGYQTSSIGTASSNSSFGSRLFDKSSKPDRMEKNKPKRSSVFSTKTKSSKKDGYTTGDESSFRTAVSGKGKKDSKRMSYTFGQTFSKSKTPSIATEHPPLPGTRMNEAGSASVKHRSDDLPVTMAVFLRDAKTFEVDVDRVKRLRLLLGSESTSWVQTFIDAGGYKYLLLRLKDLLDVEWRSEQHDDQLFFEILRCIKGLTTSEPGKVAIIEHGATPFRELVDLLYSEKKPGEVPPKQLIVDLVFSLFDIYRSVPSTDGGHPAVSSPPVRRGPSPLTWEVNSTPNRPLSTYFSSALPLSGDSSCNDNPLPGSVNNEERIPGGYNAISGFILSLLREPPEIVDNSSPPALSDAKGNRKSIIIAPASELPAPKLEMHDFIAAAHKPRIFKTYMKELSQACWDFFWIMHYGKNGIWNLADVDPETIKPRAPNGASAGVEFEAMRYLTSHFKLINTVTRALIEQDLAKDGIRKDMRKGEACRFHSEMMFSGMDRILCTVRKASTDLYPEFHLELARYIKLARDAEYDLPYVIKALITPPPQPYRRSALTSTGQQYGGQTSQHRHQNQHNYRSMQLLDTANGDCTVQSSQWLPTPTEKGDFDFQI